MAEVYAALFVYNRGMEQSTLELELRKLALEERKHRLTVVAVCISMVSILVSAVASYLTVVAEARKADADRRAQFQLGAIDVVFRASDAMRGRQRAEALERVFESDKDLKALLPKGFSKAVWPGEPVMLDEHRRSLLQLLVEYPERRGAVFAVWKAVYPKHNDEIMDMDRLLSGQ